MTLMYFYANHAMKNVSFGVPNFEFIFFGFKCTRLQPCLLYDDFHTSSGPHLVSYEPKSAKGNIPKVTHFFRFENQGTLVRWD